MSLSDTNYYLDRIEAELALVKEATSEKEAVVHAELARHYQEILESGEAQPTLKIVSSG